MYNRWTQECYGGRHNTAQHNISKDNTAQRNVLPTVDDVPASGWHAVARRAILRQERGSWVEVGGVIAALLLPQEYHPCPLPLYHRPTCAPRPQIPPLPQVNQHCLQGPASSTGLARPCGEPATPQHGSNSSREQAKHPEPRNLLESSCVQETSHMELAAGLQTWHCLLGQLTGCGVRRWAMKKMEKFAGQGLAYPGRLQEWPAAASNLAGSFTWSQAKSRGASPAGAMQSKPQNTSSRLLGSLRGTWDSRYSSNSSSLGHLWHSSRQTTASSHTAHLTHAKTVVAQLGLDVLCYACYAWLSQLWWASLVDVQCPAASLKLSADGMMLCQAARSR